MIRTFHPIGQGAFYTEEFANFTVVYDCGSATDINIVQEEIRATFEENQTIDALFISHLHDDHINGVRYLLDYCNVNHIFLPNINDDEKIQLLIHNSIQFQPDTFTRNLIIDPLETLNEFSELRVHFIPQDNGEKQEGELEPINIDELETSKLESDTLLHRKKLISTKIDHWIFIPFNYQNSVRRQLLQNELLQRNISINNVSDFESIWSNPTSQNELINAYKNIPGNFNTNSMTLYSGPENNADFFIYHCIMRTRRFCQCCHVPLRNMSGCLYFGDYEAHGTTKWNQLINNYRQYWDNIGTVQIPHHGSRYNYNRNINRLHPVISVISAGHSNKHRHPHSSTIRNIIIDGGEPIIVSEDIGSMVQFEIYGI